MSKNELILYGSVGFDWWGDEYFTAKQVREQLAQMTGDITVRINSGGGIASEGQAIYTMLVDYSGKVTVIVDGVAASAASLISMAGDEIIYRLGAWTLIHDPATPWTLGRGTEEDHLKEAELLGVISNAYADIYAASSGLSREECREIMKAETVLDGAMAVEKGFATSVDSAAQSVPEAAFDYRIYAHAPDHLRKASRKLGRAPAEEAVMAMIAGRARPTQQKEPPMGKLNTAAGTPLATTATKTDEEIAAEAAATEAAAQAEAEAAAAASPAEAAVAAATTRARRILAAVTVAGLPTAMADDLIGSKKTVEACLDDITAKWKENGDVDTPMTGAATARITRDEKDTQRLGMTQALVAQMSGAKPESDKANAFMGFGLVDMAAATIGHKGPIRSAGDKIEIFMDAGHSRSDFSGIFENALNKTLLDRYAVQTPTYRKIARKRNFNDFRVHPMVRAGDMPKLLPVAENGEIKFGTFGEKRETAILAAYGIGLRFSRQMFIDDDLGGIYDVINDYGSMIADFEEETFYAFKASALLSSDGLAVHVAGHNNLGSAAAITVASLGLGRAAIRKQITIDGKKMNMAPSILLVGPDKETEADQLVTSITPNLPSSVNPFSGRLEVVSSAQITGNRWELYADPNRPGGACFVYGYLNGAEAPRIRMDEPFGQQGMAMTVELDFGLGATDFRGTYANPGA